MKVLIATKNQGKMEEIRQIFNRTKYELVNIEDIKALAKVKIYEVAKTFEGNALIKAIVFGQISGLVTLAEDSGICVEALKGAPGVKSARYSGRGDKENNEKLLKELAGAAEEKRDCYYECAVAIYDPATNWTKTTSGRWEGRVALTPRGTKSFGYAPIFLPKEYNYQLTNAELKERDKIEINHRGQAFGKAIEILDGRFGG